MREILFKAKRKDNGKWVKGDAIHKPIGMSIRYEKNGMSVRVPVDPDTLCQYTGLTDKNGQKIWEYDICEMVYDGTIYIYMLLFGIKQNLILKEQMEKKTMDVILSISDAVKKLL